MDEHLQEVAIELTDAAIDTLTDSELVKEIPVVGTLVRLAKATHSISDRIFAKKVETFISGTKPVPEEKRAAFHATLEADPALRRRAGQAIVLALDRADDLQKTAIIGQLYSRFVTQEIPFETLRRLLIAVDRAFIEDLLNFPAWVLQQRAPDTFDPRSLDGTGLVEPVLDALATFASARQQHQTSVFPTSERFMRNFFSDSSRRPNQSMKPTAPPRNAFSVFAPTPCRGFSLSR